MYIYIYIYIYIIISYLHKTESIDKYFTILCHLVKITFDTNSAMNPKQEFEKYK